MPMRGCRWAAVANSDILGGSRKKSSMNLDPVVTFIIVLLIGIVAGIGFQRAARPSWLSRQIAGGRRADLTSALVGIAGAFIGFHLAALLFLAGGMLVIFLGAVLGAVVVLWGWREIRL
jgi:uncharacterized membrane protein YeaQ/YmgE (transglycosylase-associated protein family)